jgi:hypothetical protein
LTAENQQPIPLATGLLGFDRQRREHDLNAEPGNGHRPSRRRRLMLGIILGSFFFLVVSCYYWIDGHVPKIDRAKFKASPN